MLRSGRDDGIILSIEVKITDFFTSFESLGGRLASRAAVKGYIFAFEIDAKSEPSRQFEVSA